jgi:hypothetical protein
VTNGQRLLAWDCCGWNVQKYKKTRGRNHTPPALIWLLLKTANSIALPNAFENRRMESMGELKPGEIEDGVKSMRPCPCRIAPQLCRAPWRFPKMPAQAVAGVQAQQHPLFFVFQFDVERTSSAGDHLSGTGKNRRARSCSARTRLTQQQRDWGRKEARSQPD